MQNLKENFFVKCAALAAIVLLVSCGGQNENVAVKFAAAPPQAAPLAADMQIFSGPRANYLINKISVGYIVTDLVGSDGSVTLINKKSLQFADVRVNLTMAEKLGLVSNSDLNSIIDLYIAFFNRVPDADGLAYWIEQSQRGMSLIQIAENFYSAAIYYADQTGYSADMRNEDLVRIVYKNVLGRTGVNAPPDEDVAYWAGELKRGVSKGSMIYSMLQSARSYVNDPTWAWVPKLLDNKVTVGKFFAVHQGLNFISPQDEITKSIAIINAVTVNSTSAAMNLIPSKDTDFSLDGPASYWGLGGMCTPAAEKSWTRAHLDDVYLWYKDIIDLPAVNFATPDSYFDALLVRTKDKFSFTESQASIDGYFQSGADVGYGYNLLRQGARLRVLFVEPGSPAELVGLVRGDTIAEIDGTSLAQPADDVQFAALYPSKAEMHSFYIVSNDGSSRQVMMTAAEITKTPVLQSKVLNIDGQNIAYMVFNSHIRTAEAQLTAAVQNFSQMNIKDLVLDLRYNGGGYLYIADELAAMIGGAQTTGRTFEQLKYNDKTASTSRDLYTFYRFDTKGQTLPWLNLKRVFVLTGNRTCSASESIINGLAPFVQVIQIGENTCGKPYGFLQTNNCDLAYFAIRFSGVNALGQGDYIEGLAPQCKVAEDLDHFLGDPAEKNLSTALSYAKNGTCPAVTGIQSVPGAPPFKTERDPHPWRSIRLGN